MKKLNSNLYVVFTSLFSAALITSNIAAFKLIALPFGLSITSSAFIFVITYIVNDVVCEVYGYERAKRLIWTAFALNAFTTLYFQLTIALKAPDFFGGSETYKTVLGSTPRMLLASFSAYLAGSFINARVMRNMKAKDMSGKGLFARCILSTLFGELVDSVLFICVAFIWVYDVQTIVTMILVQTVLKTVYEIVVFPLTNIIVNKVKQYEDTANI